MKDGSLVTRDVTLTVPARGQGKVTLTGQNFTWSSEVFNSYNNRGRDVFVTLFEGKVGDTTKTFYFIGTYIRTKTKILYTGDIFTSPELGITNFSLKGYKHVGVFNFTYNR